MIITEKTVSNLIETHFPMFIQEEGPVFVEFAKSYYKWMEESGGAVYEARRLGEYRDIDNTVDSFLIYFKEKYLKNVQFNTAASTKKMVKHSLDLYRSKGSARAIDLLFKVVFNTPAEIYTPGDDLFKLSSGDWYEKVYLEITPSPSNIFFVGKQIIGLQSGTTAFVEKLTRKKVKNVYIEVFTISNLKNNSHFITGETIKTASQSSVVNNPRILGSLTSVTVLTGSNSFAAGDVVELHSSFGVGAMGLVTAVSEVTGKVDFLLVDGGFGYTTGANVVISEKVLRLSHVNVNTAYSNTAYFGDFDYVTASQGQISYINATGDFTVGANLYTYDMGGSETGKAIIQDVVGNTASGNLYFTVLSGSMDSTAYYTEANAISADVGIVPYIDQTASATIVGASDNVFIDYENSPKFNVGETVVQYDNVGRVAAQGIVVASTVLGTTGTLRLNSVSGLFLTSVTLHGMDTLNAASVVNVGIELGVVLSTPSTIIAIANTTAGANIELTTTIGIAPGAAVSVVNNSFTLANTSSIGANVTVSNTNHIIVGSPIYIVTADAGQLVANTTVTSIESGTIIGLSDAPTVALANATIRVWPSLGELQSNTTVSGIIDSNELILDLEPTIALSNASLAFAPAKFQFYSNTGNYVHSVSYNGNNYSNATVLNISKGYLASFEIAQSLSYPETIEINTDVVFDYLTVPLDSFDFGISPTVIANSTNNNKLGDILNYDEITIGGITNLVAIDQGYEYNIPPVVRIKEPMIAAADKKDIVIQYDNPTGTFFGGEIIIQDTGAKGLVKSANTTALEVRLLNYENVFDPYYTNNEIIGTTSGAIAAINNIYVQQQSKPMGFNAVVSTNVVSEFGSVSNIQVIDSGYGYRHKEIGSFISSDGLREGAIVMNLGTRNETDAEKRGQEGKSLGYYRTNNGFLSNNKKLHDGYYYQEFSYEIRSSVTLDKYEAMLKQLLHIAGTKYFASTVRSSTLPVPTNIFSTVEIT